MMLKIAWTSQQQNCSFLSATSASTIKLVTPCIGSVEEWLDLLLVLDALLKDHPAPPDREHPSNDVYCGQHLHDSDRQLRLAPGALIADTGAEHGTRSWEHDVKNEANVRPHTTKAWNLRHQLPQLRVFLSVLQRGLLNIVEPLGSELARSLLVVLDFGVLFWSSESSWSCSSHCHFTFLDWLSQLI